MSTPEENDLARDLAANLGVPVHVGPPTVGTQTITGFLEDRIAEDEAAALTASKQRWQAKGWAIEWAARVLAECAAKRAIISLHDGYSHSTEDGAVDAWCALNAVLKELAAVYADHEDYRQEWAL